VVAEKYPLLTACIAPRADVVRALLGSGVRPIAGGLTAGLALALVGSMALAQFTKQMPFSMDVYDPVVYVAVSVLLTLVAVAAMFGPAVRAAWT